ncbi:MAG: ATP synthase subunit I [Deltaproteobacteria bacterium]|nr:ATP synthase subunit I [Deltaproteobacteria bacterium]
MNHTEKDPLQKKIEITNWIIMGILLMLSFFFMPYRFTLGMVLGGFISIVNFHWLDRDLRKVFSRLSERSGSFVMVKYFIRITVTAFVLYFIISADIVDIIGLLIGLSTVVITMVFTAIAAYSKKNCLEEVS